MEPTIFQYVGGTITNAINEFVGPASGNLIVQLQGIILAGVTIYIMSMGWAVATGQVQAPIKKIIFVFVKIIVITAFFLIASVYGDLVVDSFGALETLLSSALNGEPAANIYEVIDNTLGQGMALAQDCLANARTFNIGFAAAWILAAIMVTLGTIAIVLLGGAGIIIAKFMLALLFALGPFFIVMLLFPITARFFDSWFSQAMNYTFVIVAISVIMSFAMVVFTSFVLAADVSGNGVQNPLLISAEVFLLSFIFAFLIQQTYSLAAGLAGGLSMAALTYAHMLTPGRLARNVVDPISSRRDMQSGFQTNARRHEHLLAGNTPVNPAYNQYLRHNIGKNWSRSKGGKVQK